MPLQATSGAASYDAFGGGVPVEPVYIEQIFQTYLYTGNGSTQTITNGIDLAGKGGLVWIKNRDTAGRSHRLIDTVRGGANYLESNNTDAQGNYSGNITAFNSTGFSVGDANFVNVSGGLQVSWTFRKQPKFFDIVTYTGTGSATTIAHNLGSVPGCIIVKSTSQADNWKVYHSGLTSNAYYILLDSTAGQSNAVNLWNNTTPTSTVFSIGSSSNINTNGATYIAYLFAHNAGGFGLTGTDNVISCGYAAGGTTVNLGYEPQWVLTKNPNSASNWLLVDNMRGMPADGGGSAKGLLPNTSDAESDWGGYVQPTSTGFYNGVNSIYIAIRRGPMKVPTSGTSVFAPIKAYNATGTKNTTNFAVDLQIAKNFTDGGSNNVNDRLRGVSSISTETTTSGPFLYTDTTAAEVQAYRTLGWDNTGFKTPGYFSNYDIIFYNFKRAPSFFDEVCYTGTGSTHVEPHNLQKLPEMVICKSRGVNGNWLVGVDNAVGSKAGLFLNQTAANSGNFNAANDSTTGFDVEAYGANVSGRTYVAYLFATCAGVSKVGSYTGNGSTQTIDCGFTGGARFVIIKRTDSTGGWYVYDTDRGMTVLTDPYFFLNDSAAQVATLGSVTTVSTGFALNAGILAAINTNGASYIFLAIA